MDDVSWMDGWMDALDTARVIGYTHNGANTGKAPRSKIIRKSNAMHLMSFESIDVQGRNRQPAID